jgi:lactate dehydrogenase-like 2-hydroxyacid dehydrogenase
VLPNTADTQHFFYKEVFGQMKKLAVFMNIGYGTTINEAALVVAL